MKEREGAAASLDDVTALAYDAWKRQDDNINDLYTYRLETLYGVKNITYKNEHPTAVQLEKINEGFSEYYKHEIDDGEPENSIIRMIAMEVADYVLGEDFRIFFNEKLDLLHTDMREDFIEDAKRILELV